MSGGTGRVIAPTQRRDDVESIGALVAERDYYLGLLLEQARLMANLMGGPYDIDETRARLRVQATTRPKSNPRVDRLRILGARRVAPASRR